MPHKAVGSVSNFRLAADPATMVMDVKVSAANGESGQVEYETATSTLNAVMMANLETFVKEYAQEQLGQTFGMLDTVRVFGPFEIL